MRVQSGWIRELTSRRLLRLAIGICYFKNCVHHAYSWARRRQPTRLREVTNSLTVAIAISFRLISPALALLSPASATRHRGVSYTARKPCTTLSLRTAPSVFDCTLQMINGRMRAEVVKVGTTVGVRRVASGIICYQACPARASFSLKLPKRRQ